MQSRHLALIAWRMLGRVVALMASPMLVPHRSRARVSLPPNVRATLPRLPLFLHRAGARVRVQPRLESQFGAPVSVKVVVA